MNNIPESKKATVFTGTVLDLTTSHVGEGLEVVLAVKDGDTITEKKSARVNADGEYYIALDEEASALEAALTGSQKLILGIKQNGVFIPLEKELAFDRIKDKNLIDVATYSSKEIYTIKGTVSHRDGYPAARCTVELMAANSEDTIGSALTDENGNYEISFDKGNSREMRSNSKYRLKFYNSRRIETKQENGTIGLEGYRKDLTSDYEIHKNYRTKVSINEIVIREFSSIDDDGTKTKTEEYRLITGVESQDTTWISTEKLFYIKETVERESSRQTYDWRIIGTDKQLLEKFTDTSLSDGKRNITYVKGEDGVPWNIAGKALLRRDFADRKSQAETVAEVAKLSSFSMDTKPEEDVIDSVNMTGPDDPDSHVIIEELYQSVLSGTFTADKRQTIVNFVFIGTSVSLYTQIKNYLSPRPNIISDLDVGIKKVNDVIYEQSIADYGTEASYSAAAYK